MNRADDSSFRLAVERYAALGVDVEDALARLAGVSISVHCWQGDDVRGFEGEQLGGGGIMATGGYPGAARTPDELRADYDMALSLIPGNHRANLHALYAETGGKRVHRDALKPEHFNAWMDWAADRGMALDFNPTFFSHPKAADGFTLSHRDESIRSFWIEHGRACRRIAAEMGRRQGSPSLNNVWIPDGFKDIPFDRGAPRQRLVESLDAMFADEFNADHLRDSVESKLFGLGVESYTVGSHEFYLGYAQSRNKLVCLDAGHYHPTETISDKLSAIWCFADELALHVSRPVRWDSDHVVILDDELRAIAQAIVRPGHIDRVRIGLDFFDASINRIAAWVIGTRAMLKAMLLAMLEPVERLAAAEAEGDYTTRLALFEQVKAMPFGAVWDEFCRRQSTPTENDWFDEVRRYETDVLSQRD